MSRLLSKLRRAADRDLVQDVAAFASMMLFLVTAISLSAAVSASVSLWRLGQ